MDRFITTHLKGVSRTYAILIPMLPRALAEPVGLAYLLMRVVDTFEDAPDLTDARRRERLRRLDQRLEDGGPVAEAAPAAQPRDGGPEDLFTVVGETAAERALLADGDELLARIAALPAAQRDVIHRCARQMIEGVLGMLDRSQATGLPYPAIRDAEELRQYCYYVAGVVGMMLCELMADHLRQPALRRLSDLAVELGIGLQMVNILKDVSRDARHGRRYLPLAGDGVSHAEVYRFVLNEARTSLQRGAEFVLALPSAARELRSFCGLPIAWGALTLARAERGGGKVSRGVIRSSIDRFTRLAGDDSALRGWFGRLLCTPSPNPGA